MTLKGHFDGKQVVLDEPVPAGIVPHTPVEVTFERSPADAPPALAEIVGLVPSDDLPADYAEQHEHYVKGTPRR